MRINKAVLAECTQAVLSNRVAKIMSKPHAEEALKDASIEDIKEQCARVALDATPDIMKLYKMVIASLKK